MLLTAYAQGIFPWSGPEDPVLWWSTDPRMVLMPAHFRLHVSLRKTLRTFARRHDAGIRIDTALHLGDVITPHYDPLLAKVVAFGENRDHAIRRLRTALAEMRIEGIRTNLTLIQDLLQDANIVSGGVNLHYLEKTLAIKRDTPKTQ